MKKRRKFRNTFKDLLRYDLRVASLQPHFWNLKSDDSLKICYNGNEYYPYRFIRFNTNEKCIALAPLGYEVYYSAINNSKYDNIFFVSDKNDLNYAYAVNVKFSEWLKGERNQEFSKKIGIDSKIALLSNAEYYDPNLSKIIFIESLKFNGYKLEDYIKLRNQGVNVFSKF